MVLSIGQGDVGLGRDVLEKSRPALVDEIKDVIDVVAGMHTVCPTSKGKFTIYLYFSRRNSLIFSFYF